METEVEWVSHDELVKAHIRFMEAWPCLSICDWGCFTGYHEPATRRRNGLHHAEYAYNKQGARRIRLIASSPHWLAILKAIAIQYMENDNENTKERTNANAQATGDERH